MCFPASRSVFPTSKISLKKYTIAKFNTALKPFYYQYLFNKYPDAEYITFLDPDMLIYRRLTGWKKAIASTTFC